METKKSVFVRLMSKFPHSQQAAVTSEFVTFYFIGTVLDIKQKQTLQSSVFLFLYATETVADVYNISWAIATITTQVEEQQTPNSTVWCLCYQEFHFLHKLILDHRNSVNRAQYISLCNVQNTVIKMWVHCFSNSCNV